MVGGDQNNCCYHSANTSCYEKNEWYSQCKPTPDPSSPCDQPYKQCGGKDPAGLPWDPAHGHQTCCVAGYICNKTNDYYSGCIPEPICTNARFDQCGGIDKYQHPWTKQYGHDDCCPEDFHCVFQSKYFSQCVQIKPPVNEAPFTCKIGLDCAAKLWGKLMELLL